MCLLFLYVMIFYLGVVYILTLFLLLLLLLMLASKSSSPIDPLPLSLFHKLAFILTPFILNIINISLHSGIVPSSLKHKIIKPILNKQGLDI